MKSLLLKPDFRALKRLNASFLVRNITAFKQTLADKIHLHLIPYGMCMLNMIVNEYRRPHGQNLFRNVTSTITVNVTVQNVGKSL